MTHVAVLGAQDWTRSAGGRSRRQRRGFRFDHAERIALRALAALGAIASGEIAAALALALETALAVIARIAVPALAL